MQQKTNGNDEVRMSRQDKVVLTSFALSILIIFVWSFALHFGPTAEKNTEKREKNVFYHAQIIHLPENKQQKEMVYTAIPLSRTKEITDDNSITSSFSKTANAISLLLGDMDLNEVLATTTTTSTTTTTTTTTTTSTTTTTTTVETTITEKIVEEPVAEAPAEEPAPTDAATPETETQSNEEQPAYAAYVSYTDYLMICNVVGHEYGADWVDIAEKALVAEVIMNRVSSSAFPSTVEQVLVAPNQFSGAQSWAVYYAHQGQYSPWVTESTKTAVNYYFEHISDYQHGYLYFCGDGWRNYFS